MQSLVITIDGPTASGKGTVAQMVARALGWHYLDSGAIYRSAALYASMENMAVTDTDQLVRRIHALPLRFTADGKVWLADQDVTEAIRAESIGNAASIISALPQIRAVLLRCQQDFLRPPGLVADGRDMGTVVFPKAALKVFLTASVEARAGRRYKQLIEKGKSVILSDLVRDLQTRDARDSERTIAPLKAADDAYLLDTSTMSAQDAAEAILLRWQHVQAKMVR